VRSVGHDRRRRNARVSFDGGPVHARAPASSPSTLAGVSGRRRLRAYLAFAVAGFRRHSTYRQATVAACVTNSVFGFLRAAVMLAVLAGGGSVIAGYDAPKLMTFVWAGQGLIGTVLIWAPPELAGRIRTGDVVIDLLRPVDLVTSSGCAAAWW
jgi:viologen exporter family transport system permease protein